MDRLIKVKGIGKINISPDLIIITISLESKKFEYDKTMELAAESINAIVSAIESVGFDKKELKTTSFNVKTNYETYTDKDNNYKNRFAGYICEQVLKLEFDFEQDNLSKVLSVIAKTQVNPKLDIKFSIRDKEAINKELLIQATKNAREKAIILAEASDVILGSLINIEYNWGEIQLYSPTRYEMEDNIMIRKASFTPSIEPDDITVSDIATFVWEIK